MLPLKTFSFLISALSLFTTNESRGVTTLLPFLPGCTPKHWKRHKETQIPRALPAWLCEQERCGVMFLKCSLTFWYSREQGNSSKPAEISPLSCKIRSGLTAILSLKSSINIVLWSLYVILNGALGSVSLSQGNWGFLWHTGYFRRRWHVILQQLYWTDWTLQSGYTQSSTGMTFPLWHISLKKTISQLSFFHRENGEKPILVHTQSCTDQSGSSFQNRDCPRVRACITLLNTLKFSNYRSWEATTNKPLGITVHN